MREGSAGLGPVRSRESEIGGAYSDVGNSLEDGSGPGANPPGMAAVMVSLYNMYGRIVEVFRRAHTFSPSRLRPYAVPPFCTWIGKKPYLVT